MWVLPAVAAAIALVFAGLLLRQFLQRKRAYQLLWAIALLMYAIASAALAVGILNGWSQAAFSVYWIFGAVLNVPFLAAGELELLTRNRMVAVVIDVLLVVITVFAVVTVRHATFNALALTKQLPSGKHVFGAGTPSQQLPQYVSYPAYFILLGGALWSAWKMRGRPELKDRFVGTLLIAVGATVVAGGATFAAFGLVAGFIVTLVAGISVMFWGFLLASRHAPAPAA
jgi:uncharacterized integral membrane protein